MCPSSRDGAHGFWSRVASSTDPSHLELAFTALDRDGDGAIRSGDLSSFFMSYPGQAFPQVDAEAMIAMADLDGNGAVDFKEFQHFMTEGISSSAAMMDQPESRATRDIFQVLDMNKDGFISAEDLKTAMELSGALVSHEELDAMIAAAGGSRKAPIDFDSFSKLMTAL